ncbi:MAG: L-threonylcarbamoyladenylate synthase [Actinomycetota bacterium]|nr:L-threonylcarbamoyladenylate synthase [Actinomycetota bacterium]
MTVVVDARADRVRAVARAAAALGAGRLVVLPTDTVYGVAGDAFNPAATARIFLAKARSRSSPLAVLVHSSAQLDAVAAEVPPAAARLIGAYWPGPLTIVFEARETLAWDLGDTAGTVAVRMPHDEVALEIIRAVGPLAVTSANRSGEPAAHDIVAAQAALGEHVEVYVDDGPRHGAAPSTVVDITRGEPLLLREGDLAADEVVAVARGEGTGPDPSPNG